MALSKFQNLESSYNEIDDNYQASVPGLYYSSGVYPLMDKDKVGAFDFSCQNFPDIINMFYLHGKQYDESIQETGYPLACTAFIQDLRASSYILFISNEIDELIIERVMNEFKSCSNQYGNKPRQLFIVTNNAIMSDYIKGKRQYSNDLSWVDIKFSDKYNNFDKIHDRFAILDDHIWHCGAGIGGMHKMFHALSGPWEDVNHSFREYCKKIFF